MSAVEQHYHELLHADRSPLWVDMSPHPAPTHSPICVGQSFITLPSSNVADSSHSNQSQPNPVSLRLEKRGQAYIHLPDVGLLQLVVSPSPQIFLTPRSQVGSLQGGQRWPAEGGCKRGRPHQARRRRMASFSTFCETKPP